MKKLVFSIIIVFSLVSVALAYRKHEQYHAPYYSVEKFLYGQHHGEYIQMTKKAHFVTFYSPGTFVCEETTKSIKKWDINIAKEMVTKIKERYGTTPFAFEFSTRARKDSDLDSKETKRSNRYYLGGKVETLAQVKARATKKDEILISNMECNKWSKIITNTNSWKVTQPLRPKDVILAWP